MGALNEKDYGDETAVANSPDPSVKALHSRSACSFTLFENAMIKVIGNTNASHGYLYLIAFPKATHTPDNKWIRENEDPNFDWRTDARWSGSERNGWEKPPEPGTQVSIQRGSWQGIVLNQVIHNGYIHVSVLCDKVPEWKEREVDETHYYDSLNPSRQMTGEDYWESRGKTYGVEVWPEGRKGHVYLGLFIGGDLDRAGTDWHPVEANI